MSARPVLGVICCDRVVGPEHMQTVANRYVAAAMQYADAAALLIPSMPALMQGREVVDRLDGLLLTGSPSNVEPSRYGQGDAADAAGPYDRNRDTMMADLVAGMLARKRPTFGICRGLQELNVVFGGTLRRDMSRSADLLLHHAPDGADLDAMFAHEHAVDLVPGGLLHSAMRTDTLRVNSVHYQGVDQLGSDLIVEARAADGVVEAFSAQVDDAQVLAVHWHPEWNTDRNPQSQAFFHMLGRALRGEPVALESRTNP